MPQEKFYLPNGQYIEIPDDASPEYRAELDRQVAEMFPQSAPAPPQAAYGSAEWYRSQAAQISGILGETDPAAGAYDPTQVGEGTVLGSAWEGIKSIPRGVRQFSIMAQQGWEGLQTPDEDTEREKELRQRMEDLMMEIDPKYRDSNLVNVGMGLGQVAGMIGLGAGASALGATGIGAGVVAGTATALMGAGEQASRIAEFEERTGQDVSAAKEQQALAMGLGIGLSEMLPLGKFGRALGLNRMAGATISEAIVDNAADLTKGKIVKSMMRQAGEEALQEGAAGFAQSATARYLYDDEALANAGVEALREAMVGGQVGAITDAVIKMSTRAIGNRRGARGDYILNQTIARKYQQGISDGSLDIKEIEDLVTGADTDPALADLRASIVDIDADGNVTAKTGEGSILERNMETMRQELSSLRDAFDAGAFGDPATAEAKAAYQAEIAPVQEKAETFNREIDKLVAAYQAQANGTLGTNVQEDVADAEEQRIRVTILPEEANKSSETQAEYLAQNPVVDPRSGEIVIEDAQWVDQDPARAPIAGLLGGGMGEPTLENIGSTPTIGIEEVAAQLEIRLGKTDREIKIEEAEKLQAQVNEAGRQLYPINRAIDQQQSIYDEANAEVNSLAKEPRAQRRREERLAELNSELNVIDNGVEATQQVDTDLDTQLKALDASLQAEEITLEEYEAQQMALLEDAPDALSPVEAQAVLEETLGINQLQNTENINLDTTDALTKTGKVKKAWSDGGYTAEQILQIRANQRKLRELKKRRTKVRKQIKKLDPKRTRDEARKKLDSLTAERTAIMEGDYPRYETVTVREMAKRGVEPYVQQYETERKNTKLRLEAEATRAQLRGDAWQEYVKGGMETAPIGEGPVQMLVSGGRSLTDPVLRDAQYDRAVFEARDRNDVRVGDRVPQAAQRLEGEAIYKLEERLKTPEQRQAYNEFVQRLEADPTGRLTPAEVRLFLQSILLGGPEGGLFMEMHGLPFDQRNVSGIENLLQYIGAYRKKPAQKADRDSEGNIRNVGAISNERGLAKGELFLALDALFGFGAVSEIDQAFDAIAHDQPPPRNYKGISLGNLASIDFIKLRKKIESQGFDIGLDDIEQAMRLRGFTVPKTFKKGVGPTLRNSEFLDSLIYDTLGTRDSFNNLHRAEKELLLARILSPPLPGTDVQVTSNRAEMNIALRQPEWGFYFSEPPRPRTEQEQVKRTELKYRWQEVSNGDAATGKPKQQVVSDAKSISEAGKRIEVFKEALLKRFQKLGLGDLALEFVADADSVFSEVKDVIVNGAFVRDENGELVLNDQGKPIYRPAFRDGSVASLQNYGTRVMFNLSQIVNKYGDNWVDNIDTIVRDITAHEGAHVHFIRNNLSTTERRALKTFGRREGKVPASVSQSAHDRKLTWEQFVKEKYPDLTEDNLIEETSVHILDALVTGKLAPKETAGLIGKIKRQLSRMFGALAESVEEAELVPVLQAFEKIQNVSVMKERSDRQRSAQGLHSLQFVDRAKQEDLQALRKAIADGDPAKIDAAAQTIIESREEFQDQRTDLQRLQDSLISELRARREIDGNPDAYAPVLNREAIESGRVTADSLDAYFRFIDGREPPFRMPPKEMDMRDKRAGRSNMPLGDADMDLISRVRASGRVFRGELAPAESIIKGMNYYNTWIDKSGRERTVEEMKDFTEMLDYTASEMRIKRFFDKRIPMWKSHKRGLRSQIAEYGNTLTRLAEASAIAAWRIADNAMNFIPMVLEHGPIAYVNGGFVGGQNNLRYAIDIKTGEFRLDANGQKIPVKGLKKIYDKLLEAGEEVIDVATDYMAALRILDVHAKKEEALGALREAMATGNPTAIEQRRREYDEWIDAYDRTNPKDADGKRFYPLREAVARKKEIQESNSEMSRAVVTFGQEYADFNYYQIEFAMDTGLLSKERGKIMQSMAYVPFYRDQGWQSTNPMANRKNDNVEKSNKEAEEDDFVPRGAPLIDKSIRGSFLPIDGDLFANLQKNAQAIVRDGMNNIAVTRTMRDELANGTAVEIKMPTAAEYSRRKFLQAELDKLDEKETLSAEEQRTLTDYSNEHAQLDQKIKTLEVEAKALHEQLDDQGFSEVEVRAKGVSTIPTLEVVLDDNGEPVIDPNTGQPQTRQTESVIDEGGVAKTYRVLDPQLSRAIMDIGFSPQQAIEDFFGKTLGIKDERINKGIAKLAVGGSEVLREAVTRSPAFMVKNILRDGFQASVVYGGGPKLIFKAFHNAFFAPNLVAEAESRGLGIAVDYQPDDQETRWHSTIPYVGTLWNLLGHASKRSEVATRMAVYDHALNKTEGNAAEALYQAIELINYGRRGSSRLFTTLAAMAPFVNGRMQGLHVLYRSHSGALDAPGLFMEEGWKMDAKAEQWARRWTTLGRGSLITMGTLIYFMAVHDDEEYKNAREDMKNDWWLIPLGTGKDGLPRPGFKMPIPFEVGLIYKVIPEQILRTMTETEHDLGDMTDEMRRQITASLYFDLRPQLVRPVIDAMMNRDAFQRDQIVPQWMEDTVGASQHYNPYTNRVAKLVGQSLDKIPLVGNLDFLTSPMKIEYMLRQYTGSIGGYVMLAADRVAREAMGENVVGTAADFGSLSQPISARTFANIPVLGDLFYDPAKGGGYQEDFYEAKEALDRLITTLGQIRENEGYEAAKDFEEKHQGMFQAKRRLQNFDRRMRHYRHERDNLFERNDLSKEDKRRRLYRMFETRDDMLEEMLKIMSDIRRERNALEAVIGE